MSVKREGEEEQTVVGERGRGEYLAEKDERVFGDLYYSINHKYLK